MTARPIRSHPDREHRFLSGVADDGERITRKELIEPKADRDGLGEQGFGLGELTGFKFFAFEGLGECRAALRGCEFIRSFVSAR